MIKRKILLVEPAYRSKYPPLGLMKLATYHKIKGDKVKFVRGMNKEVQLEFWDRVYITTLFSYTWNITVKTIKFYTDTLFGFANKIYVGGILATLMKKELYNETGIIPITGLLDDPKKIEQDDDIIIDRLYPDYNILKQVEIGGFKYTNTDAYLGYATKGCINNCQFCAVNTLEPKFLPYIDLKTTVKSVINTSGEKQHLLLMDNNILASPRFYNIIDDIKEIGFVKNSKLNNKKRTVDFNQGLEAKLLTEDKMKKLSEIPLEPMRLAFDDIKYRKVYERAVRLAHKYNQKNMSNYILYNFKDSPEDFYQRLKINIDLNDEFKEDLEYNKTTIYSFPMRYIPLTAKRRNINTGNKQWNDRLLRGVKAILQVTRGIVMPGSEFFYQAFGRHFDEFKAILLMPDNFIIYRLVHDWKNIKHYEKRYKSYVAKWMNIYFEMGEEEQDELSNLLSTNNIIDIENNISRASTQRIKTLLDYHLKQNEIVEEFKNE